MSSVQLTIIKPANGQVFTQPIVSLAARVDSTPSKPLFFAWYSSLHVVDDLAAGFALHRPDDPTIETGVPFAVGTHVLTFTARDVFGDSPEAANQVTEAGLAGGPPDTPDPCLVTVLAATLRHPVDAGAVLSKAGAELAALAPTHWSQPEYQAGNRVGYSFVFGSAGLTVPFTPDPSALAFIADPGPEVRYNGPLPAQLEPGAYELRARVFDLTDPSVGHESPPLAISVTD